MKGFLIFVIVVIIAALGYTVMQKGPLLNGGDIALSASFACADSTHFVAEFEGEEEVEIRNDNDTVTIPRVEGDGQRFEDATMLYVFAGEEASVTTKADNKTTTCTQPVDANNAPVNFGDAAEGGGTRPDVDLVVAKSIQGKWQSTEDAKFVREFRDAGIVVDTHDGKNVVSGTWKAFTKTKPLDVAFPLQADEVYIEMTLPGSETEKMYFKVGTLTPETLTLIYMDRGGSLNFTSVK